MYGEKATSEQINEITRLAAAGATPHIIAKELGVSASKVHRWLEQNHFYCAPASPKQARVLNAREQAEFRTYYKTQPNQKAIFAKYQIGRKTLQTWLKQMNLDPTPASARPQTTNRPANSDHCRVQLFRDESITRPGGSIADRFRAQGLATIHPDRY
jgi:transposase